MGLLHFLFQTTMKFSTLLFAVFVSSTCLLASCSKSPSPTAPVDTTVIKAVDADTIAYPQYGPPMLDTTIFYSGMHVGKITDQSMAGASGIAASHAYPGMFWVEDDQSVSAPTVYLVDTAGGKRAYFSVTGASNRDWTDMTIGAGPNPSTVYLYLADIGDSKASHATSTIYRVPEPQTPLDSNVLSGTTAAADKIIFKYPDGPRDAETILIDPATKDLYIVDKGTTANVYFLPYPQSTDTVITVKKILTRIPNGPLRSGGISSSRRDIVIKSYLAIFYWKIAPGQSILDALLTTPVIEPILPEIQGEAMCFSINDDAYWTTSKFSTQNYADLNRFRRK